MSPVGDIAEKRAEDAEGKLNLKKFILHNQNMRIRKGANSYGNLKRGKTYKG